MALLYVAYRLVKKAFDIPARWSLLALLPVTFLLATNTFMGYWIYYMKMPGYYYVAVLGFISILASLVAYKKMRLWGKFIFLPMSVIIGYPLIGVYSLVGALLMGVHSMINAKNIVARIAMPLLALMLIAAVPALYYYHLYTSTSLILMYGAAVPAYQWTLFGFDWFSGKVWVMWLPFLFLFLNIVIYVSCGKFKEGEKIVKRYTMIQPLLLLIVVAVTWSFWFSDTNFRIELAQDKAMWDEDWERVADLGQVKHTPTRQIVMNRNIALLRTRRAGEEMFRWEDGSAETKSLISVRLAQTGGKMSYYQYGRFNFCYRWCVEDAVEFILDREKPLAMYLFGDEATMRDVLRRTSSGGACINDTIMHIANEHLPFGGVGNSGMGRYHGRDSLYSFSHRRAVVTTPTWIDVPFRYMPYRLFRFIKRLL